MKKPNTGKKAKLRTLGSALAVISSVIAVVVFAGRRKPVNEVIQKRVLQEDLEQYLAISEARFDDIIPGAEKTIIWADSNQEKTKYSIVYLHGFSATRQETYPLSDKLAETWGANLFYTRLAGHGQTDESMGEYAVNDWLNDADEALAIGRQLGEQVIVIGTSTGGTLATWLAMRENAGEIAALVLISPNYWVRASGAGAMLLPWGKQILQMIQGPFYEWEPVNEKHAQYWTYRYPSVALLELMKLLDYVNSMALEEIQTPALFIYSPEDKVVDSNEIEIAFSRFGSKNKHKEVIENTEDRNSHVLAGDILSPGSTDKIAGLINKFIASL